MSNLIERLRTEPFNHWELRHEAADEIERLTALRKEDREDMQRLSDQVDYLSDENAKLQAALESIANNTCCEGCQEAKRVALAALEDDNE